MTTTTAPATTVTVTVSQTPPAQVASQSATPIPSGAPQTGGGIGGGGDMPLAVGGGAAVLAAGTFGLLAVRRLQHARTLNSR